MPCQPLLRDMMPEHGFLTQRGISVNMYSAAERDDRSDPLFSAALDGSLSHAIVEHLAIALPDAVAMVVVQDHDRCASNFVLHTSGAPTLTRVARLETPKPNGWIAALWKM
jgi:hypothetical protein